MSRCRPKLRAHALHRSRSLHDCFHWSLWMLKSLFEAFSAFWISSWMFRGDFLDPMCLQFYHSFMLFLESASPAAHSSGCSPKSLRRPRLEEADARCHVIGMQNHRLTIRRPSLKCSHLQRSILPRDILQMNNCSHWRHSLRIRSCFCDYALQSQFSNAAGHWCVFS